MPTPETESGPDRAPGVFSPRQARSARTQAAILDVARQMLDEGGVESLTVAGLAARVGLTTGAFYARFRNKKALLRALFEETRARNQKTTDRLVSQARASEADLPEIIATLVPPALELIRDGSALFRLFGSDHSAPPDEDDRAILLLEGGIRPIRELLHEHSDEIPGRDPDLCATMLVLLVQGMVDWSMLMRHSRDPMVPMDDEALAEEIIRAALGYLGLAK